MSLIKIPDTVHFNGVYFRISGVGPDLYVRIDNGREEIYLSINQAEALYKFLKELYEEE